MLGTITGFARNCSEIVDAESTTRSLAVRSSICDGGARFARGSFSVRLGLRCYYRLSGRFVMTPEAAILVLSAAHYRQGMTVVRFIFFFYSFVLYHSCPSSFPLIAFRSNFCQPRGNVGRFLKKPRSVVRGPYSENSNTAPIIDFAK